MDRDQRLVEAAAVGHSLAEAPGRLGEPLTAGQRERPGDWLSAAALARPHENGRRFFPVPAAAGLRAGDWPVARGLVERNLAWRWQQPLFAQDGSP
ncbi:DUF2264 domain-containing protein [Streptomyces sp.]|uniref:DUF2264 domain-containing protein n=1 Tax=Streptomyces sp. TaxID=1931 RepID=UPI0028116D07|nr:DUF2264 domain-containing protein [Streptomyces sp.]